MRLAPKQEILSPALEDRRGQPPGRVSGLYAGSTNGIHRVEADLAGADLWFESSDMSLIAAPEAFGSALLFAAAAHGRRLAFENHPDPVWLNHSLNALSVSATWWNYPRPQHTPAGLPELPVESQPSATCRTALCFSGGVDSFYTLLRSGERIAALVFVHGYDIPLADTERAQAAEGSVRTIARQLGIKAVVLRTNLRAHPASRKVNWEHAHGGALAATGHLLADHVDRLLISASYPRVFDRPWGTHWALDPWWSSSRLTVAHAGAEKWRAEKLFSLRHEPLVQQHLRVCWENLTATGNCGRCEKCLRTMLVLEGHGGLADFPVFPSATALAENIARIARLRPDLVPVYESFLELSLSPAVHEAVAALVERSRNQPGNPVRVLDALNA